MINNNEVFFTSKADKQLLSKYNLITFNDFWNIENSKFASNFGIETKRSHKVRGGDTVLRETCQLNINGETFFLKRSSGKSLNSVKNELNARKILPNFNLSSSDYAAYAINKKTKTAFILMKNLDNFIPCPKLLKLKNENEEYNQYFKDFSQHLINSFSQIQQSDYFYRDWFVKHLFYNPKTKKIAVIDLERFYALKDLPFYYCLKTIKNYKRKKERMILAKTLKISLEYLESKLS